MNRYKRTTPSGALHEDWKEREAMRKLPEERFPSHRWYSVQTPSVFKEIKLPANEDAWTNREAAQYERLRDLAELHRVAVQSYPYRIG